MRGKCLNKHNSADENTQQKPLDTHLATRTGVLAQSRDRLEQVRGRMDLSTVSLLSDDLPAVVRHCREVFEDLRDVATPFRPDWVSLDLLLSQLVVAQAWCRRRGIEEPSRLEEMLRDALAVRMAWLAGEDA